MLVGDSSVRHTDKEAKSEDSIHDYRFQKLSRFSVRRSLRSNLKAR